MSDSIPLYPPCGATHIAKNKLGQWVWLFDEPTNASEFESVDAIQTEGSDTES